MGQKGSKGEGVTLEELRAAARSGDIVVVRQALKQATSPLRLRDWCTADSTGATPLFLAAAHGHAELIPLLLANNSDVRRRLSTTQATPLHAASEAGHLEVVRTLIALGAEVNAQDKFHDTPHQKAAENGHFDVMQLLQESGARDKAGPTAARRVSATPKFINSVMGNFCYHKSTDTFEAKYKLGKKLGVGTFATVRLAMDKTDNMRTWAAKILHKKKMTKADADDVEKEVKILGKINHPNVVGLREVFDSAHLFYMVIEVMEGGDMYDHLSGERYYTEKMAVNVIKQMCSALKYCHAMETPVVHRDLKPENLLYSKPVAGEDAVLKISDFGLSKLLDEETLMMHTCCGTPGYAAPEILRNEACGYTAAVDLWSLGVILYTMLCGFPPFYDENNAALYAIVKACSFDFPSPYWDDISAEARDLINHLLVLDVGKRFTAAQVLEHRWVTGKHDSGVELKSAQVELRKFNARRRFRAGVHAAYAINRIKFKMPKMTDGHEEEAKRIDLEHHLEA